MIGFSNSLYVEELLPLQTSVCPNCPIRIDGRCEGIATPYSFRLSDPSEIGCSDLERVQRFYHEVKRLISVIPQPCNHDHLDLPCFIPVLKDGGPTTLMLDERRLSAISMSTLLKDSGDLRFEYPDELRLAHRLSPNARLALVCTTDDCRLERFWRISEEKEVWSRIAKLNFEFVTGTTHSVWNTSARSDQIIAQEKNFISHDEQCAQGIPSIPFLFFYPGSRLDFDRILFQIRRRPKLHIVAILAQLRRSSASFRRLLEYMRAIKQHADRNLRFLVVGAAEAKKIRLIYEEFPDSIIVNDQPFMKGLLGFETDDCLAHKKSDSPDRGELIRKNIGKFDTYCYNFCEPLI